MSITVFSDVFLSGRVIDAGIRGRNMRRNSRVSVDSGQQSINIVWQQTLRQFEVGFIPMRREAWQDIETLHEITEGGAYGFLMYDPKDHYVPATQGILVNTTGSYYQLYKRYTEAGSGRTKDRKITRPKVSGFTITDDGVALTSGVDYTLDEETGIVTQINPTVGTVRWTGFFYVPVHFMDDQIDWQMVVPSADPDARFLAGPTCVLQEVRE